jgi:hypothetical protein
LLNQWGDMSWLAYICNMVREPRFGQCVCSKIFSSEDKLQTLSTEGRIHV